MFNPEVLDEPKQGSPRKDGKKLSMAKRDTTKYVLKDKNEVHVMEAQHRRYGPMNN